MEGVLLPLLYMVFKFTYDMHHKTVIHDLTNFLSSQVLASLPMTTWCPIIVSCWQMKIMRLAQSTAVLVHEVIVSGSGLHQMELS